MIPSRNSPWIPGGVEPEPPLADAELPLPDPELLAPASGPTLLLLAEQALARSKAIQALPVRFVPICWPPLSAIVVPERPM